MRGGGSRGGGDMQQRSVAKLELGTLQLNAKCLIPRSHQDAPQTLLTVLTDQLTIGVVQVERKEVLIVKFAYSSQCRQLY